MPRPEVFGWDIGGAHVKACRMQRGVVLDVAQWPCPLWLGLAHLEHVIATASARWPQLRDPRQASHAVTMTGEMTDLFAHREDGVQRIAALLAAALAPTALRLFAGDAGWCDATAAAGRWRQLASANWLATATHAALALPAGRGLLLDIGSTTTDIIAFADGRVLTSARSDAERLASGTLVYQGVVRTPLCALGPRIDWLGQPVNVMNEFFATTADVYRLTGELSGAHDQQPAADNGPKDTAATQQRLARMIGMDAREATAGQWLAFAMAWRARQLDELAGQIARVQAAHGLGAGCGDVGRVSAVSVISAGCGDFLVPELLARLGLGSSQRYATRVAGVADAGLAAWAQVCAPCIAVAALCEREQG